jgi:hypothetical protein
MNAGDLLAAARDVIETPRSSMVGTWSRAGAFLARQAIEASIDDFWQRQPSMAGLIRCSMATQLRCLPLVADRDIAHDASYTWGALSSACHYHPYELLPTAGELMMWLDKVATVIEHLERQTLSDV